MWRVERSPESLECKHEYVGVEVAHDVDIHPGRYLVIDVPMK